MVSDNMPFNSRKVSEFANEWMINVTTSNPYYAQSYGQAEHAIQRAKNILRKADEAGTRTSHCCSIATRPLPVASTVLRRCYLVDRYMDKTIPVAANHLIPEVVVPAAAKEVL